MQRPKQTTKTKQNKKKTEAILNYCWKLGNIKPKDTARSFIQAQPVIKQKSQNTRKIHALKNNHFMHYKKHNMLFLPSVVNREFSL